MRYLPKILMTAAILACLDCSIPGLAASTTVTVGSPTDRFTPSVVTINAGDSVIWSWTNIDHSTTSGTNGVHADDNGAPGGLWDSGVYNGALPHTFTNTFITAGNYSYYCQVHYPFGMTGSVNVTAVSAPPALAITNPASGAVFAAPANVTLQAAVTNGSNPLSNVQFLVGANVLTNETTPPFAATTNNLAAGNYTLSAVASDNAGLKATNSVSISVVTPVTVTLTGAAKFSGTNFQFSYPVNTGLTYIVQLATNLAAANWISLATNVAASNPVVFTDNHATNNPGFYRVGRLPNP